MYNAIIKGKIKEAFGLINQHQYAEASKGLALNITHTFSGNHALGGIRHDQAATKLWFERVGRLLPDLHIEIDDVLVRGWPNDTLVIARWHATAGLKDGSRYANHGVHFVRIQWGKITEMTVYEDSLAVSEALERQYAAGISEAKALPIIS
ncbi:nuclear transport factor 2 family protein [Spirosoma arcticum]